MNNFPFHNLNADQLRAVFADSIPVTKSDCGDLKKFLYTLTQNDLFTNIKNDLSTDVEFNNSFFNVNGSNTYNLKVLHLNIQSKCQIRWFL